MTPADISIDKDGDSGTAQGDEPKEDLHALWQEYWGPLSDIAEERDVPCCFGFVVDPKVGNGNMLVMMRGHQYDLAKNLAEALRHLKQQIAKELET